MPPYPDRHDAQVAQTAAEWVARRDRGLDARERAELAAWEAADPRHPPALVEADAAWRRLDALEADASLDAMAEKVVTRARARQQRHRLWRTSFSALGAAAAIVVGLAAWSRFKPAPPVESPLPDNIQVLASTLRSVMLPDGSIAEINGMSRIEVNYTPGARRVRLTEGEAHFIVTKDPTRPFYVSAGPVTVRAVGTAFNVRLAASDIEVLVTEGRVQVEPEAPSLSSPTDVSPEASALVAGQRARIDRAAGMSAEMNVGEVARGEIEEALGWQGTRLVFSETTLDDVVAAFNRYNRRRLTLGDASLRQRRLTGTFRADNLEGFLRLAGHMVDVKAEQRTSLETVLLPAR